MASLVKKISDQKLSRRDFLKITATGTAGLALAGQGNHLTKVGLNSLTTADSGEGKWITAACWHNCGGRCLNKVLMKDGVVVRQKTDDTHPDSPEYPQQRGCLRGRAQQQQCFGADRLKYPMKRKHWEPLTGGDKSLRGKDEWERISWDEALDYVANELKHSKEKYGNRSILYPSFWMWYYEGTVYKALNKYGGFVGVWDTTSFGTYTFDNTKIGISLWDYNNANDRLDLLNSETVVLYGCNPAWASAGNPSYNIWQAKEKGAEFIFVGPRYNDSASLYEAKWIRVRNGTDMAFLFAVAYTLITEDDPDTNPLIDWDFIENNTIGFDASRLPESAKLNENFVDYVLGKYDGIPKTPEWATEISGTPVEDIRYFARAIRKDKKVALLHSYAAARCKGAEDLPQLFLTIGAMTGHFGKPGHCCGPIYHAAAGNCGGFLIKRGSNGLPGVEFPVDDTVMGPVLWDAVLDGKYNFTGNGWMHQFYAGEERDLDIHVIYHDHTPFLQICNDINKGIEAHRKVDFVVTHAYSLKTEARYSDIVLPVTTRWERPGGLAYGNREMLIAHTQVTEPLYEAKSDQWITIELAKRLGIDPDEIFPFDEKQMFFNELATITVVEEDGVTFVPLLTITQADIDEWDVEGTPQQGRITLKEYLDAGIYQVERHEGDNLGFIAYEKFVQDPENNPVCSPSGKFELYCDDKADTLNALGYDDTVHYKPYPTYQPPVEGYEATFSDWDNKVKGEYPYLVYNPHYIRRAHTSLHNLPWLREAFANPAFISATDAAEKGVKTGDTIILWNQYGKTLRNASVTETLMPGSIALPHGAWVELDEETGIDKAGADNILCGAKATGMCVSGYNNVMVNFEKYDGEPLAPDHEWPQRIVSL